MKTEPQLFIGVYPCGLTYADRWHEKAGDYARLAFLPYATLNLDVERDCPPHLRKRIVSHAATMQAKRGQEFRITTCGQTVMLGDQNLCQVPVM